MLDAAPTLGIDLHARHREVEKLVAWRAARTATANGWPLDEVLSDVFVALAVRNRGRWSSARRPGRATTTRALSLDCGEEEGTWVPFTTGLAIDAQAEEFIDAKRVLERLDPVVLEVALDAPLHEVGRRATPEQCARRKKVREALLSS